MTRITDLENRAVLITGASTGIGAALARGFAAQRSRLALHFNSHEEEARLLARELAIDGHEPTLIRADLVQRGEARRVVDEAARALGGLNVRKRCNVCPATCCLDDSSPSMDWPVMTTLLTLPCSTNVKKLE
jgi:NAD(P)-dependent dehydrogenase (short-subunit alcohol dehydrogenase family)